MLAFKFNLCRYTMAAHAGAELLLAHAAAPGAGQVMLQALAVENLVATLSRGRAVQVDPMKPKLKPPGTKRLKLICGYTSFNFCFQIQLAPLSRGGLEFNGAR